MKYQISVITRLQDCGDGGYTMYIYNSERELLDDHYEIEKLIESKASLEKIEEMKKKILTEDDPYENGYIGNNTIEVEIVDEVAKLSKKLSFHAGQ